jgi:NADH:ubiquinone oxidoreductase subunit C
MQLQEKIKKEGRRRPWKIGSIVTTPIEDLFSNAQEEWAAREQQLDEKLREAREQFKPTRLKKETFPAVARKKQGATGISNWTLLQTIQKEFPSVEVHGHQGISPKAVAELWPDYTLDLVVPPEQYLEFAEYLRNEPSLGLDMLLQLTCVDWQEYFDVVVQLLSVRDGHKLFFRSRVDKDPASGDAEIATLSDIYRSAEWHEREVYDMFGVRFSNHPDLRRIFLENEFPGYPLRKDYDDPTRVVKRPY